jgi:class 3 adenylate cyclase
MSASIPSGTVTFTFTDIEGSTKLLQELGDEYATVARDHRRLVREAFTARGGTEVDTQGDAFFFSFPRARDAVGAAVDAQRALAAHAWPQGKEVRVRMGLHTGEPTVGDEGYLGLDVVRAARIAGAGHGGQILISETTRALLGNQLPDGAAVHDLGEANLKDVQHEHIFQVSVDEEHRRFPPLKTEHPKSAGEALAERIQAHVAEQIEQSFKAGTAGGMQQTTKLAAFGLVNIVLLVVAVLVIVLLVRLVF